VRRPGGEQRQQPRQGATGVTEVLYLQPTRALIFLRALGLIVWRFHRVAGLLARVLLCGRESVTRRARALLHTFLGAYYAVQLRRYRVNHIHVHHGYFGSWIAMVAARLLGVDFSLTLHGSDLLLHGAYLDTKLRKCRFCITVSEYNRTYILKRFAAVDSDKILVARLGVEISPVTKLTRRTDSRGARHRLRLLSVGRLHAVKDHAFLVRACADLRDCGFDFECEIAGEGPEQQNLDTLIREHRLQDRVRLIGHVSRRELDSLYEHADVVVLNSRSEGIPLVLMEAMAHSKIVVAPAITGVPELVIHGRTGFLYAAGMLKDFVARIAFLEELIRAEPRDSISDLDWVRHAARFQVLHNYNREKNMARFTRQFLRLVASERFGIREWSSLHEDIVLQQI
jgi:glycosyltransferase involved in cell wall biosynthesis